MTTIFISRNREQLGQFTEEEVRAGLRTGQFLDTDLAWKEGMAEWQVLSSFNLGAAGNLSIPQQTGGTQLAVAKSPTGRVDIGECCSIAWATYKSNFAACLVAFVIYAVIHIGLQVPMTIIQTIFETQIGQLGQGAEFGLFQIMGVGAFLVMWAITTSISMIVTAGLMYFYVSVLRGQSEYLRVFSGFLGGNWWKILAAGAVSTTAILLVAAILIVPALFISTSMNTPEVMIIGVVVAFFPIFYISIAFFYTFPLIIDQHLGPVKALMSSFRAVNSQLWQVFVISVLVFLLAIAGMLLCCIGMLFTLPLGYLIIGEGYRRLFGDPAVDALSLARGGASGTP